MTKPDFLVIGSTRCGSSWLYKLFQSHPEIYVPKNVKEVHYFNKNYQKGIKWYERFFPKKKEKNKRYGEITPEYLFDKKTPERIKKDLPNAKFIISLRNPITKLISSYKNEMLYEGIKIPFEEYAKKTRKTYQKALYAEQIERWFKIFPKNQFLILIFEETIKNPEEAAKKISKFLKVDVKKFDKESYQKKTNYSYTPLFPKIFILGAKFNEYLIKKDHYKISNLIIKIGGLFRIIKRKNPKKIEEKTIKRLEKEFEKDIKRTEKLIGKKITNWNTKKRKKGKKR